MEYRETRLKVGGLVVSLATDAEIDVSGYVDSFIVDTPSEAMIRVRSDLYTSLVGFDRRLPTGEDRLSSAEDVQWHTFRAAGDESVLVHRTGLGFCLEFAPASICREVDIWLGRPGVVDEAHETRAGRRASLVELLPMPVVVLLAGRHGLFLHSCAVTSNGEGILFAGVSGSGKSTMAGLWRKFGGPATSVIDDEHIIAHRVEGETMLYGAPWKRGPREATAECAPLRAVFFLSHGAENRCVPLSPGDALAQLMSQVFLPVWSREQMELTMQTSADLVQAAECYQLEFIPDGDIVRFVQDHLRGLT